MYRFPLPPADDNRPPEYDGSNDDEEVGSDGEHEAFEEIYVNGNELPKFAVEQIQPSRPAADQKLPDVTEVTIPRQRWNNSSQQQQQPQPQEPCVRPPKQDKPAHYITVLPYPDEYVNDVRKPYVIRRSHDNPQPFIKQSNQQFDRTSLDDYVEPDDHVVRPTGARARPKKPDAKKKIGTLDTGRHSPPAVGDGDGGKPTISTVMSPSNCYTIPARIRPQQQPQPLAPPGAVGRPTYAWMPVSDSLRLPPTRSVFLRRLADESTADDEDSGIDSSSVSPRCPGHRYRQNRTAAAGGKNTVSEPQQPKSNTSQIPAADAAMQTLGRYSWYIGDASRKVAENHVQSDGQDGSFVVRNSSNGGPGKPYTLTIYHQRHIYHIQIRYLPELGGLFAVGSEKVNELRFVRLEHVVRHYHINPIELVRSDDGPDARWRNVAAVTLKYKRLTV